MMKVLTDEQTLKARDEQVANVAKAICAVTRLYPAACPLALTSMLQICGTNFGLLSDNDFAAARVMARG